MQLSRTTLDQMIQSLTSLSIVLGASALLALQGSVMPAQAQSIKLGIVAPMDGDLGILGSQVRVGVGAALSEHSPIETEIISEECSVQSGNAIADQLVAAQATAVVGFLCTESLLAALPKLRDANIPIITPAIRTPSITERREATRFPVFRLAPRTDAEATEAARLLLPLWRDVHFAIVDDGTLYGRELAEPLRAAADGAGLKPVFIDTYRPQLESQAALVARLRRAGATHVFIGGDRADIAVIGANAEEMGYELTIAGGESLLQDTQPLPEGTLAIAPKTDVPATLPAALQRTEIEGYVLPAFAATQVVIEAARIGGVQRDVLSEHTFETVLGSLKFDPKGDANLFAYRLLRFDGSSFVPLEANR
ncbi:branched-chain amino acid ABC transporter substrate-binding protein [Limoniibacter endophyticus]|uniref:Amino acid-binding protein n=1 Tax=Limoniibacter endophyticus TaxID=1565040 RepID=A0A8J3GFU2_9HYPH|nr:branched-chain amino acid ABC transporter substrate-binding protein [Limoniibacter endophyticus]GHC60721.1 amino acid-binding protein [Limoniibacter endophyticus]